MAITVTKSRLVLILVIVFTVLVAAAAIGTAIILQSRGVGPTTNNAATQAQCDAIYNSCVSQCGNAQACQALVNSHSDGCRDANSCANLVNQCGNYHNCQALVASHPDSCSDTPACQSLVDGCANGTRTDCGNVDACKSYLSTCSTSTYNDINSCKTLIGQCGNYDSCVSYLGSCPVSTYNDIQACNSLLSGCGNAGSVGASTYCRSRSDYTSCVASIPTATTTASTTCSNNSQCGSGLACNNQGKCVPLCDGTHNQSGQCQCGGNVCYGSGINSCSTQNPAYCLSGNAQCAPETTARTLPGGVTYNSSSDCYVGYSDGSTRFAAQNPPIKCENNLCVAMNAAGCLGYNASQNFCGGASGYWKNGTVAGMTSYDYTMSVTLDGQALSGAEVRLIPTSTSPIVEGEVINTNGTRGIGDAACFKPGTITTVSSQTSVSNTNASGVATFRVNCYNSPYNFAVRYTLPNGQLIEKTGTTNIQCHDTSPQGNSSGSVNLTTPTTITTITTSTTSSTPLTTTTSAAPGSVGVNTRCVDGPAPAGASYNLHVEVAHSGGTATSDGSISVPGSRNISGLQGSNYTINVNATGFNPSRLWVSHNGCTGAISSGGVCTIDISGCNTTTTTQTTYTTQATTTTTPQTQFACQNIAVTRNGIALADNAQVTAGDQLSIVVTGNGATTGAGFNTTVAGGAAVAAQSGGNPFTGSFTVPGVGSSISFNGFATYAGQTASAPACNRILTITQTVPQCKIDKVVTVQTTGSTDTPVTGSDACIGTNPSAPGCQSVNLTQNDVVTYKLVVSNPGTAAMTNVVVNDSISITGTGSAQLIAANGTNPNAAFQKCTAYNASTGICTGVTTPSYTITSTFPKNDTDPTPHIVWQPIASIAPGEYYQAEIQLKATASGNYRITNGVSVASTGNNTDISSCKDFVSHDLGTMPPTVYKQTYNLSGALTQNFTAGDTVEYQVVVKNTSASPISGLTVVDQPQVPFSTYFDTTTFDGTIASVPAGQPQGVLDLTGNGGNGQVTWTGVSVLANSTTTLKFRMKLRDDLVGQPPSCTMSIPNNVAITVGSGTTPAPTGSTSIIVSTKLCGVGSLTLVKTSTPQTVAPGGTFHETLTATASGTNSTTVIEITDYMPTGFSYAGNPRITLSSGGTATVTATTSGNKIIFTINSGTGVTLQANQSLSITFDMRATSAKDCVTYVNVAQVTNPTGPSAQATMSVCILPNTGLVDNIVVTSALGMGLIVISYSIYRYDLINRINTVIRSRGKSRK